MRIQAANTIYQGEFDSAAVEAAALKVRDELARPATLGFAFCTPDYSPHLEEFCEILRVDGHITDIVGCTSTGIIGGQNAFEQGSGFSVLAIASGDPANIITISQGESDLPNAPSDWIVLANPYTFDMEDCLTTWKANLMGGLAVSATDGSDCAVFHNGYPTDCVAAAIPGSMRAVPVVNQACKPIGEPLTVTRAENNIIYSLGSHPAYQALESAFEALSDNEKATARGNLFAGLAGTEYVEEFRSADFLARNILGADPSSGAVVIGGVPRVGQTLQYLLRDPGLAALEFDGYLQKARGEFGTPTASLLFPCVSRTREFFGQHGRDSNRVHQSLGDHPTSGCYCNGELGPVGRVSGIHSHSVVAALLYPAPRT